MIGEECLQAIFRVGFRYTCTLTVPLAALSGGGGAIAAQWVPELASGGLTDAELRDYRRGRDDLLAEATRVTGVKTLVVEL